MIKNNKVFVVILSVLALILIGGGIYLILIPATEVGQTEEINKEEVRELINTATNNINNLNSFVIDYNMYTIVASEDNGQSISMSGTSSVDLTNEISHTLMSMLILGTVTELESYTVIEDGVTYTYATDFVNGWSKSEGESMSTLNTNEILSLINVEDFEVVENDDIYTVTIMVDASMIDTTANPDLVGVMIPYVITIEDDYITSIVVKMKNDDYDLSMEIYYSRFNEDLGLEVPVEALDF